MNRLPVLASAPALALMSTRQPITVSHRRFVSPPFSSRAADICGTSTRKTHVILTYNGKNLLTKKNVRMESDKLSHRYTLILRSDNTYEVQIDGSKAESGSLYDDWDFLAPKKIKDPSAKKPSDWVDNAEIADPTDKKPAGYDDAPAKIPDPAAKKPEDWDDEEVRDIACEDGAR